MSRRNNNSNNNNSNDMTRRKKEPRIVDGAMDDSDDDEEIDEDGAFNSEDELMYGSAFASSSSSSKKKMTKKKMTKKKKKNEEEDTASGKKPGGGKRTGGEEESDDDDDGSSSDGDSDSDDDESDENDWAGSSDDSDGGEDDDGGQYMLDLLNNLDGPTAGEDGKAKGAKTPEGGGKIPLSGRASAAAAARLPEGEHRSGSLGGGGENGENGNVLTLDSLMGSIADTAGFASVQRSMRALSSGRDLGGAKKAETTSVPVSRVVSDRASRKVHYEATTKDVSMWTDAVHEGRDAETLDFRSNGGGAATNRVTRDTLVEKFEPSNDFEREIRDALERAGMEDEGRMARREKARLTGGGATGEEEGGEDGNGGGSSGKYDGDDDDGDDDLGSNVITAAEYKRRHGELAKLRALMFYEEQKRHRINKIKSKKYRKIRKRQRERMKDGEDEASRLNGDDDEADNRERAEREEMDRMRERMTLAHKNTSKWARHMLRRGSKMDVEERRALSLQVAKGEELRRKAMGVGGAGGVDDDGDDNEDETEEDLLERARDILMETRDPFEDGGGVGEENGKKKKGKGLFSLEFMKRGMEAQRARAKEEARKLLEELESNELAGASGDDDDDGEVDDYEIEERKSKKTRVATEAETGEVLPGGKMVASSLIFGRGDGFAIQVDGNIELGGMGGGDGGRIDDTADDAKEMPGAGGGKTKKSKRKKRQGSSGDAEDDGNAAVDPSSTSAVSNKDAHFPAKVTEEEENPWIVTKSTKRSINKPLSRTVNVDEAASMLVDVVVNDGGGGGAKRKRDNGGDDAVSHDEGGTEAADVEGSSAPPAIPDGDVGIADLSQAELVRRAFAAPADLEAEAEFEREKVSVLGCIFICISK